MTDTDALEVQQAVCAECDHIKPTAFDGAPCFADTGCPGRYEIRTFREVNA